MTKPTSTPPAREPRLLELLDGVPGAAFAIDDRDRVVAWSPAAEALVGRPAGEVEGRELREVFEARDAGGNLLCPSHCGLREMVRRGEAITDFALEVTDRSGCPTRLIARVEVAPGNGCARPHLVFGLMRDRRQATRSPRREVAAGKKANGLTERQRQVLGLLADDRSTAQVAADLSISVNTVRNHEQNILRRLDTHSLSAAVAAAIRRGLI